MDDDNTNSSHVESALEIFNLLKKIQKSRQLIELSFESPPQQYLTSLLSVQRDEKTLIFDEPNPQLSSKLTESVKEVQFSLKLGQLPVKFKTILSLKQNDSNKLLTPFPKTIYYPQHRQCYRFRTEFINDIKATIFLSSAKRLSCKLLNISLKGICLSFPYSFAKIFQINQYIDDIYIQLPQQNGFSISAKVMNSREVNNYNNIAVGFEILEQKSNIEKIIQRFIFRTENL